MPPIMSDATLLKQTKINLTAGGRDTARGGRKFLKVAL